MRFVANILLNTIKRSLKKIGLRIRDHEINGVHYTCIYLNIRISKHYFTCHKVTMAAKLSSLCITNNSTSSTTIFIYSAKRLQTEYNSEYIDLHNIGRQTITMMNFMNLHTVALMMNDVTFLQCWKWVVKAGLK